MPVRGPYVIHHPTIYAQIYSIIYTNNLHSSRFQTWYHAAFRFAVVAVSLPLPCAPLNLGPLVLVDFGDTDTGH